VVQQLRGQLKEKDDVVSKLLELKEKKNLEIDKLRQLSSKTEYEMVKKELEACKAKILCSCGTDREREVVLKTCPHIFCKKCIENTTSMRNRKCPICNTRFTKTDIHEICWT
jgi:E3 ubiquitin-protein ligase BRE1